MKQERVHSRANNLGRRWGCRLPTIRHFQGNVPDGTLGRRDEHTLCIPSGRAGGAPGIADILERSAWLVSSLNDLNQKHITQRTRDTNTEHMQWIRRMLLHNEMEWPCHNQTSRRARANR